MRTIKVWRWEDAPKELRELSTHGGDEDWVVLWPAELPFGHTPIWISHMCYWDDDPIIMPNGDRLWIAAHS